ncbi:hypothetical protein BV349_02611 [Pseudomonas syringae pv. actinidiae]|nr:hypothetical protein BV349_02611 [Pseudomonas syringae pv. actinidiae]OSN76906.1 hypothetical protein BV351_02466 [Pseudomonas syringae pv. actinidiae]RMS06092.1 hypothetical protein ALP75_201000 [Pseudomonas syringae pv. actinidiae]
MRDALRHRSVPHCTSKRGRRASRTACDAERLTIVEITACRRGVLRQLRLSFPTLQRGNALRDALRHESVPHSTLKRGRRASRTACDAERRTIVEITACRRGVLRQLRLSFPTLQRGNALRDALRHKSVPHNIQERTQSVQNGMRRRASHDSQSRVSLVYAVPCRGRSRPRNGFVSGPGPSPRLSLQARRLFSGRSGSAAGCLPWTPGY